MVLICIYCFFLDVSQPSLGTENEPMERLTTPPLSPMCSLDGASVQVSLSSKGKVIYAKPSSTTSMDTHWEEAIKCAHPDKRDSKQKRGTDLSLDADDTESELIAIPESEISDSTLQGSSVQDSFEEGMDDTCCSFQSKNEKVCAVVKIQEPFEHGNTIKTNVIKTTTKRPTFIIGSEDESLKSWENKNYSMHDSHIYTHCNLNEFQKYSKKISALDSNTSSHEIPNLHIAKTIITDSHKLLHSSNETQHFIKSIPKHMNKNNQISSVSTCYTQNSECDNCFKNNQPYNQNTLRKTLSHDKEMILPAPSIERLLPIGAPGKS